MEKEKDFLESMNMVINSICNIGSDEDMALDLYDYLKRSGSFDDNGYELLKLELSMKVHEITEVVSTIKAHDLVSMSDNVNVNNINNIISELSLFLYNYDNIDELLTEIIVYKEGSSVSVDKSHFLLSLYQETIIRDCNFDDLYNKSKECKYTYMIPKTEDSSYWFSTIEKVINAVIRNDWKYKKDLSDWINK